MEKKRRSIKKETKKKKKIMSKKKKIILGSILGVIVAILAYGYITQWLIPAQKSAKPLSILVVGTDIDKYRDEVFNGTKPERTDAVMLATFNPNTYKLEMTSIPRDTAVDYVCPGIDEYRGAINDLYELSGKKMKCVSDTISKFLNVPIDYYVKVDMSVTANIIDSLGGINTVVHAKDGSFCQANTKDSDTTCFTDGEEVSLDGDKAMLYARFRKDSEQDYGRGLRQQQVITGVLEKVLGQGLNFSVISNLLSMVETNMEIKIMYDYANYFSNISNALKMISGETKVEFNLLPSSAWKRLFEVSNFKELLINQKSVEKYIKMLQDSGNNGKDYFVIHHQFFNSTYNGFYLADDDERKEISNALRKNLELEPGTPDDYEYGLRKSNLPFDEDLNGGGSQGEQTPPPVEETPPPVEEPKPEEKPDTDKDGVTDDKDICPGFDDNIDTDKNGTPDGCDKKKPDVPKPEVPEEKPDTDKDGVTDDLDICEGYDDAIDEDKNGIPDGCDVVKP